jgi:hypothetical protein
MDEGIQEQQCHGLKSMVRSVLTQDRSNVKREILRFAQDDNQD